jgi:hypothetical protein
LTLCTDDSTADRSAVRPAWITGCKLPPRPLPGVVLVPFEQVHVVTQENASSSGDGPLLKDIDRPRNHQSQDHEGAERLHSHDQFAPAGKRHHIGRAERGGVGKADVEVVEESRAPTRRSYRRVELLGEGEVWEFRRSQETRFGTTSVKYPVEEGKAMIV